MLDLPKTMSSPSLLSSALTSASEVSEGAALVADDQVLTMELQMRIWSELEDAYWHTHFADQPFYVIGRGYDQYRPALALGWGAALRTPDGEYVDIQPCLEQQWAKDSGSSLLPWREVRAAVQAAWVHARMQQQLPLYPQASEKSQLQHPGKSARALLRHLSFGCHALAQELQQLSQAVTLNDFAAQVLQRHIDLLSSLAKDLSVFVQTDWVTRKDMTWSRNVWRRFALLKVRFAGVDPEEVFLLCQKREAALLGAYRTVLSQDLPLNLRKLLEQQMRRLGDEAEKIQWVRENWVLSDFIKR